MSTEAEIRADERRKCWEAAAESQATTRPIASLAASMDLAQAQASPPSGGIFLE